MLYLMTSISDVCLFLEPTPYHHLIIQKVSLPHLSKCNYEMMQEQIHIFLALRFDLELINSHEHRFETHSRYGAAVIMNMFTGSRFTG